MGWKRILNKKGKKGRKQTGWMLAGWMLAGWMPAEWKPLEWKPTEGELQIYLEALVAELNFRLFMEQKEEAPMTAPWDILMAMQPEQMLWVESITLISYEEGKEKSARRRKTAGKDLKKQGSGTAGFFRRLLSRFIRK